MANIRERLTEFAKTQGFRTLSGFEKACGFTKNTLTKGHEGMSTVTLCRIADFYPQLSMDWLILERGTMLVEDTHTPTPSVSIGSIQTVNIGNWNELVKLLRDRI